MSRKQGTASSVYTGALVGSSNRDHNFLAILNQRRLVRWISDFSRRSTRLSGANGFSNGMIAATFVRCRQDSSHSETSSTISARSLHAQEPDLPVGLVAIALFSTAGVMECKFAR